MEFDSPLRSEDEPHTSSPEIGSRCFIPQVGLDEWLRRVEDKAVPVVLCSSASGCFLRNGRFHRRARLRVRLSQCDLGL